jgi:hypothetical protein
MPPMMSKSKTEQPQMDPKAEISDHNKTAANS